MIKARLWDSLASWILAWGNERPLRPSGQTLSLAVSAVRKWIVVRQNLFILSQSTSSCLPYDQLLTVYRSTSLMTAPWARFQVSIYSSRVSDLGPAHHNITDYPSQDSSIGSILAWYRKGLGSNPGKGENFSVETTNWIVRIWIRILQDSGCNTWEAAHRRSISWRNVTCNVCVLMTEI